MEGFETALELLRGDIVRGRELGSDFRKLSAAVLGDDKVLVSERRKFSAAVLFGDNALPPDVLLESDNALELLRGDMARGRELGSEFRKLSAAVLRDDDVLVSEWRKFSAAVLLGDDALARKPSGLGDNALEGREGAPAPDLLLLVALETEVLLGDMDRDS